MVRNRTADLEKRSSEIEALYQADEKMIRSVTLNHIFQTLVSVSVSMLQADRSVVFSWNEQKAKDCAARQSGISTRIPCRDVLRARRKA